MPNKNDVKFDELFNALQNSWGSDTCFDASEWSPQNPARGQCVVSSLVAQEYLGGDLKRYRVNLDENVEMHYCNVLNDGTIIDTTGSQYAGQAVTLQPVEVDLKGYPSTRAKRLADKETNDRYTILSKRVSAILFSNITET